MPSSYRISAIILTGMFSVSTSANEIFLDELLIQGSRALPTEIDDPLDFIYKAPPSPSLANHQINWQTGSTAQSMWNDSYWPMYRGILAYRYLDKANVPQTKSWSDHYTYYINKPAETLLGAENLRKILSPAEKYDLLIGDTTWGLTRAMWSKGEGYFQKYQNVPSWFGICQGWAAATHMFAPLPKSSLIAQAPSGETIEFTPSDIRALESYLWAYNLPESFFIGSKCKSGDDENLSASCLDNNPMSWHLAILHRVGRDRDSVVMDSSKGAEIWNYAIDSYYFRYFNAKSLKTSVHWEDVVIPLSDYKNDPFRKTRAPQTRYLIGVIMDVFFPAAIEPREKTSSKVIYQTKQFVYDLELDDNMNIVGGEWHSNERPDFLWTSNFGAQATSKEDSQIVNPDQWDAGVPVPAEWAPLAKKAAARGEVLHAIVNGLVKKSVAGTAEEDPEEDVETEL